MSGDGVDVRPLDATLIRVVVLMRALGWVWLMVLGTVTLVTGPDDLSTGLVIVSMALATVGAAATLVVSRSGQLAHPVYVIADGVVAVLLALTGPVAGAGDFIAGGYPASWLFIVAYASNMRLTAIAGAGAGVLFAALHVILGLGATRAYGSIQFLVIAVVVGWGFDALRRQDHLRAAAEAERAGAQAELVAEQARAARLEERSAIAIRLHDSVLQTLRLIRSSADDAGEVRYLARAQERDLRRTISEYESPFRDSFRSRLLEAQADIEDMYRVEISQVVKDDDEMDDALHTAVDVARDVMANAVRDDGATKIDLFAELNGRVARISIRTHPTRDGAVLSPHIEEQLGQAGGTISTRKAAGDSREVGIEVGR